MNNFGMKTMLLLTSALIISSLSCKKHNENLSKRGPISGSMRVSDFYPEIHLENGMLVFPNKAFVDTFLNELDTAVSMNINSFNEQWGNLNEEEYNAKIDELGFDEDQPLIDFENYFSFNSIRKKIRTEEDNWLNTTSGEDISADPDNFFIDEDNIRSILNENREVKIEGVIYIVDSNQIVEISDGSFNTLAAYKSKSLNSTNSSKVKVISFSSSSVSCESQKRKSDFSYNYNNTYRIKWVVSHWTHVWSQRRAMAKTKNYKKSGGHWKKYSVGCTAKVYGYVSGSSGDCSNQVDFNPGGTKWNTIRAKKVKHPIIVQTKTSKDWIHGGHGNADGLQYTSTLTW